ncbi:MAG: NAD-dependent epimerase/dehydratase family protein [Chloroflexota bacterium]|nr:MAG: NAD-dependent epimerase/dehydratase family protein [Chloroflexota bacterium]
MKILIIGGTVFLGRHLVEAAVAIGHEVTLFNRGQHNPELFPRLERLRGDRDGDLKALESRKWDAVIDTCGYVPRVVRQSAALLADAVDNYVFVSTISVYVDPSKPGIDEESPLETPEMNIEEVTGESYGPLKVGCEQVVSQAMQGRSLIIRPGLIVGPNDPTDRFTYWPVRMARGGQALAPAPESAPAQIIDVRDLAEWTVRLVENGQTGIFNATGPEKSLSMGDMLEQCRVAADSSAEMHWLPADYLLGAGVQPWSDLPLWLPGDEMAGLLMTDVSRAVAAGLTHRPLYETARDTLNWAERLPQDHEWRAGLSAERESELLEGWRQAR